MATGSDTMFIGNLSKQGIYFKSQDPRKHYPTIFNLKVTFIKLPINFILKFKALIKTLTLNSF